MSLCAVLVGMLTVLGRRHRVLLGLCVIALRVVVGGRVMMMLGSGVMTCCGMMGLGGRMLGCRHRWSPFSPAP